MVGPSLLDFSKLITWKIEWNIHTLLKITWDHNNFGISRERSITVRKLPKQYYNKIFSKIKIEPKRQKQIHIKISFPINYCLWLFSANWFIERTIMNQLIPVDCEKTITILWSLLFRNKSDAPMHNDKEQQMDSRWIWQHSSSLIYISTQNLGMTCYKTTFLKSSVLF